LRTGAQAVSARAVSEEAIIFEFARGSSGFVLRAKTHESLFRRTMPNSKKKTRCDP